jgi:Fe-S cluster assembly iron-binding protein IscA
MVIATPAALSKLGELIAEHPEDPVVRLTIVHRDDERIIFGITLESVARPDDVVQDCDGVTIATEARSAARMDGVTLDYREPGGFRFIHPEPPPPEEGGTFQLFQTH